MSYVQTSDPKNQNEIRLAVAIRLGQSYFGGADLMTVFYSSFFESVLISFRTSINFPAFPITMVASSKVPA